MNYPLILNLLVFLALLFGLSLTRHTAWSLAKKVLLALVVGVIFGLGLHLIYGAENPTLKTSIGWFDLVGSGYVQLLQMIVIPLVFASILSAVARLHNASSLGKISFLTIGTLLFTTMIAALVGIGLTNLFGLTAEGLVAGAAEMSRLQIIQSDYAGKVADLNVPQLLLSFIPQNPFADLARAKPTSIISVVIFAAFLGVAALQLFKDEPEKGSKVLNAIDTLQAWVMRLVRLVMKLTPYGVLALMTKVVAMSNLQDIIKLGSFVVVSYIGLAVMFVIHGVIVSFAGVNPLDPVWIATLVAIVTLSSAGVAGVGGGATFAALIVLPAMGLPVSLVALLISVEPLIDMGRTALNVSGAMVAGTVTSQIMHETDKAVLAEDDHGDLAHA